MLHDWDNIRLNCKTMLIKESHISSYLSTSKAGIQHVSLV